MSHANPAAYAATVYRSIDEIDAATWNAVCGEQHDVFISQAFIRAFERSMGHVAEFHHVVVRDDDSRPVAVACLCLLEIDISKITGGLTARIARIFKPIARSRVEIKVLLCGLPISSACNQLRIVPNADRAAVLTVIDALATKLARRAKAKCISYKEFNDEECEQLTPLLDLGYRKGANLPKNRMLGGFADFDAYCQSLKSRKRSTIKRSRRKFADAGLTVQHIRGGQEAADLLTDDVHQLYLAVLSRAHASLEELSADYFRQVAIQMRDRSLFTFIKDKEGKIVAFAQSLIDLPMFYQMFVGVDYAINTDCDLYFNLFYNAVDEAFRLGATTVDVGQSSDEFKRQKLGARHFPSTIYLRGVDWLTRLAMKLAFNAFLPKPETILKEGEDE